MRKPQKVNLVSRALADWAAGNIVDSPISIGTLVGLRIPRQVTKKEVSNGLPYFE